MKILLAGKGLKSRKIKEVAEKKHENIDIAQVYVLESYYYLRQEKDFLPLIPELGAFFLDSGAFTFLTKKKAVNWDEYIESYAAFINTWNIEFFFELDIDSIVGLSEVERLRAKLEKLTNKRCIPVWHKNRGKDYYIRMCQEYDYVAIGGIVAKEIPIAEYERAFPWFIRTAHANGAKIHGLGYSRIDGLHKYHFDSVDSSSWLWGNCGGYLFYFDANLKKMRHLKKKNSRVKTNETATHNFLEWVKFSIYAEKNL